MYRRAALHSVALGGTLFHQAPLHQTTFIPTHFCSRHPLRTHNLHHGPFTPDTFYNIHLLHQAPLARDTFYTRRHLVHQTTLTPVAFSTTHLSQQTGFTWFYTKRVLDQTPLTHRAFYAKQGLRQAPCTPDSATSRRGAQSCHVCHAKARAEVPCDAPCRKRTPAPQKQARA